MSGSYLYGSWSIKEAGDIGKRFRARCHAGFDYQLTEGKEYIVKIETRILTMSPLCSFIDDRGKMAEAHLERFTKIEEIPDEQENKEEAIGNRSEDQVMAHTQASTGEGQQSYK